MTYKELEKEYKELIDLRNRISNHGTGEIFEEDYLLLDRILDILEILLEQLDQEEQVNAMAEFYEEMRERNE